jgi:hypothetical protein
MGKGKSARLWRIRIGARHPHFLFSFWRLFSYSFYARTDWRHASRARTPVASGEPVALQPTLHELRPHEPTAHSAPQNGCAAADSSAPRTLVTDACVVRCLARMRLSTAGCTVMGVRSRSALSAAACGQNLGPLCQIHQCSASRLAPHRMTRTRSSSVRYTVFLRNTYTEF